MLSPLFLLQRNKYVSEREIYTLLYFLEMEHDFSSGCRCWVCPDALRGAAGGEKEPPHTSTLPACFSKTGGFTPQRVCSLCFPLCTHKTAPPCAPLFPPPSWCRLQAGLIHLLAWLYSKPAKPPRREKCSIFREKHSICCQPHPG